MASSTNAIYPIIFVHGAAGSELDKGGTNLWPGSIGGIINDSSAAQMALNSDGKTDCCGKVTATKVLRYGAGYDVWQLMDKSSVRARVPTFLRLHGKSGFRL